MRLLYLLRHGERGHGPSQDTLTVIGIEQARRAAYYFETQKIDRIISGNSIRAIKTTEEISKMVTCKVEYTADVNEQSLGELQGKSSREYEAKRQTSGLSPDLYRPPKGENRHDAYTRAQSFLQRLKGEEFSALLVVSHAGFISDLISLLLGLPMEESVHFKTSFCAISRFRLDERFKVEQFSINDTTHLALRSERIISDEYQSTV